jgi:hypothetical protein
LTRATTASSARRELIDRAISIGVLEAGTDFWLPSGNVTLIDPRSGAAMLLILY